MSAAAAMRLTQLRGEPRINARRASKPSTARRCRYSSGLSAWACMNIRVCLVSRCPLIVLTQLGDGTAEGPRTG
jgi:hypothetical protein